MSEDLENLSLNRSESDKIKQKLHGRPYLWKDVWYCIFNNAETFPETLSFLCRIKIMDENSGVIYCTNPERHTYVEWYFEDLKQLDDTYKITRRKILKREKLTICWEGKILNYAERS